MDNVNGRVVKTRRAVHEIVVACLRRVRADRELSHVQQKGLPCAAFLLTKTTTIIQPLSMRPSLRLTLREDAEV